MNSLSIAAGGRFSTVFFILLQLLFLANLTSSRQIELGQFTQKYAHGLDSGSVTLLNTKQILIRNFKYDGKGPDAWFQIKQRETPSSPNSSPQERDNLRNNPKIPDEKGSCGIVKGYNGQDITLTLPANLTWSNIDYLALYCYEYTHNFGYINIYYPPSLNGLDEFPRTGQIPAFCTGAAAGMNSSGLIGATLGLILVTMFSRFIT